MWCCTSQPKPTESNKTTIHILNNSAHLETVELKVKDAVNSTEAWVTQCKKRRQVQQAQRFANQERRQRLEESRTELISDKYRCEQELEKLRTELASIDQFFAKLVEAEEELERAERELDREEADMARKEESVKEHYTSITALTTELVGGLVVATPSTSGGGSSPILHLSSPVET